MRKDQIQQGDILIRKIKKLPKGAKLLNTNVVAEGEATGHAHTIERASILELDGLMYVDVTDTATITHQEHLPLTIPKGVWQIGRVQEYDYIAEQARIVVD
jgi:hypothetical protein